MWYPISLNFRRKPIKFCNSEVTEILLCLYKQFVSYDRAKMEKIGNFFAFTWLIFAGWSQILLMAFQKDAAMPEKQVQMIVHTRSLLTNFDES